MATVNRLLGCAAGPGLAGVQGSPLQSVHAAGGSSRPSHQTVPSGFSATLVNRVFFFTAWVALGFELMLVPGATPKKPASGLTAYSRPSPPGRSQAMSSPTVHTLHPLKRAG